MRCNHIARYVICVACYYSGLVALSRQLRRALRRPRILVLAYHSFSAELDYLPLFTAPTLFRRQMEYLARHFHALTLEELAASLQRSSPIESDTVAVTVDDGYADSFSPLMYAATRLGVPSTVYVATDHLDRREPTSAMALVNVMHYTNLATLELSEFNLAPLPLTTRAQKETAIRAVVQLHKGLPAVEQQRLLSIVVRHCDPEGRLRALGDSAMLSWDEARVMQNAGIEIGAHTLTHPMPSRVSPVELAAEIRASMLRIRDELGSSAKTFAYSHGSSVEFGTDVITICRRNGIAAAVVLEPGDIINADRFAIPRTLVANILSTTPWGTFSTAMWACELEGIVPALRQSLLPRSLPQDRPAPSGDGLVPVTKVGVTMLLRLTLLSLVDADLLQLLAGFAFRG